MKKSTLALSIAAAIGGLGFAATASAAASSVAVSGNGIGDRLIVPYFSAQSDNATLLNITNTDTTNGKVVKVRFRGAANSDDLFDFTVLLSPGDVWTAAVSQGADGLAKLTTSDKSCTLPQSVNKSFSTFRLDPSASTEAKANGTREGYVEIINMADIDYNKYSSLAASAKLTSLFKTVKHVSGVAPCSLAVLTEKLSSKTTGSALDTQELVAPTATLSADWIIMNQVNTAAWSGSAVALKATTAPTVAKTFWPQVAGSVTTGDLANTADPLLTTKIVSAQPFDLPDLSTPYGAADAVTQAADITAALAVSSITNSYTTSDDIGAVTDFVFSQPTRRYHVAVNYTATTGTAWTDATAKTGTKAVAIFQGATSLDTNTGTAYYAPANTSFEGTTGRVLCLNKIKVPTTGALFDREETTPTVEEAPTEFTISPVIPGTPVDTTVYFCGETNVISINNGGTVGDSALSASVTRKDITFGAAYQAGWMTFNTPGATASGLPILGGSFMRVNNGAQNYGFMFAHKTK